MTDHEKDVLVMVSVAAVYVPADCEGIRIDYWDTDVTDDDYQGAFYGTGEESGEQYQISFAEVDLKKDIFYKLVAMNG